MLTKVEKVASEIIIPDGNVLVVHHSLVPIESFSDEDVEPKRHVEIVRMDVVFQQTLMPDQRVNFIKPKKHDFL